MKILSDYLEDYQWFSAKASDVARQLNLAGIAVVWIFKAGGGSAPQIPKDLVLPLEIFSFALALDLLHYVAGAAIWGMFHRIHERRGYDPKKELRAPRQLNWLLLAFFWLKTSGVFVGYIFLIRYLTSVWT